MRGFLYLRLGPIEIKLQRRNGAKPPLGEMGATGTRIFGGLLGEQDYNPTLQTPEAYAVYEKMRNDGQVRAALSALKLPLLNADWFIESASDTPQDREIAERLEQNLMEGMTVSWRDYLRQLLLSLDHGSMPFEKVWEITDGLVTLRKLAPRLPKTVQSWLTDETGGFAGITQYTSTASGYKTVTIPVSKLLLFVNDLEGSNWRGASILRSAYGHWYFKDGLYRVAAIAMEKRSLGVDVGTLEGDAISETGKKDMEKALMALHAHEKQFMVEVEGQYKYRLEGLGSDGVLNPLPLIEHHDVRIVRSILAEFLAMGQGSTGSLAMHRDKSAFFMMALGGIANQIVDIHNTHLIKPWVNYNWDVDEYPRLRYSRLESRDLQSWAEAVSTLTQAGALHADPDIEKEARSLLDLPPKTLDDLEPEEMEEEEEMSTDEMVAAVRMLRKTLKRRRETAEVN